MESAGSTGSSEYPVVVEAGGTDSLFSVAPLGIPQQAAATSRSLTKNVQVNDIAVDPEMLLRWQMQRRKMEMAHQLRLVMLERLSSEQILSLFARDMIMRAQAQGQPVTPVPKRMHTQQGSPPDTKRKRIDP